jgi:GNAT superfamily N-acetyltransferase
VADLVSIVEGGSELLPEFAALTDEVWAALPAAMSVEVDTTGAHRPTSGQIVAQLADAQPTRRRCSVRLFLSPGRARAAAIVNPRLVDAAGKPLGLIGFFEAQDDEPAARAVLHAAAAWLRERGATSVRGPINFTTWHDYRLIVERTSPGGFTGEPCHPSYYPRLWQAAGFAPTSRYGSYWTPALAPTHARFAARAANALDAGVMVRPMTVGDLPALFQLAMIGFADAHLFSRVEPDEFAALYGADRAASVAGTTFVAVAEGRPLGFLYTYVADLPDGPAGIFKSVAVHPDARGRNVYQALFARAFEAFLERGLDRAIAALIHVDGSPAKMGWQDPDRIYKHYALFELTGG